MELNPKYEIFVNELSKHGNKTRAYKEAYPDTTDESARVGATKLLKRPDIRAALKDMYIDLRLGITNDKHSYIFQEAKILMLKREYLLGILSGDCFASINEKLRALELDNRLMEMEMVLLGYGSIKQAKHEYMYQGFAHTYQQLTAEQAAAAVLEADEDAAQNAENLPLQEKTKETAEVTNSETVAPERTVRGGKRNELKTVEQGDVTNPETVTPARTFRGGIRNELKTVEEGDVTNSETVTKRNLEQERENPEQTSDTLINNDLDNANTQTPAPDPVTSEGNSVTYIPLGMKPSPGTKKPSIIKRAKQHKPATVFNNAKPGKRRA